MLSRYSQYKDKVRNKKNKKETLAEKYKLLKYGGTFRIGFHF